MRFILPTSSPGWRAMAEPSGLSQLILTWVQGQPRYLRTKEASKWQADLAGFFCMNRKPTKKAKKSLSFLLLNTSSHHNLTSLVFSFTPGPNPVVRLCLLSHHEDPHMSPWPSLWVVLSKAGGLLANSGPVRCPMCLGHTRATLSPLRHPLPGGSVGFPQFMDLNFCVPVSDLLPTRM